MAISSGTSMEKAKKAAGKEAAKLIQNGMKVGLGTGSTAAYFIEELVQQCKEGLKIEVIATSLKSYVLARDGGIPLLDPNATTYLDITVDGADEIDPQKRMIKGGGGALLREKIVASMSQEMVVIVDEAKVVPLLGKCSLPIEIVPFAFQATIKALNQKGYFGKLRAKGDEAFITDNENYIYDISFETPQDNPEYHEMVIKGIPGVVTTGFFFHLAGRVIIGCNDGTIKTI
jgi:ribose 5-phosphate isomerase A